MNFQNIESSNVYYLFELDVLKYPQPSSTPSCRKSARVTQSQNVPVSCFSQPIGQWLAQAA